MLLIASLAACALQGRRLDSPVIRDLCAWMTNPELAPEFCARETRLHKVAVADFDGLRGVMALEDIAPGEEIVAIPARFALDLGTSSTDPLAAAEKLCVERIADQYTLERPAYFAVLPPPGSPDLCTPEFFDEAELAELQQWPLLLEAAQRRRAAVEASYLATDKAEAAALLWAQWAVLSRVLTVAGPDGRGHKLLIPFMDLFNHDRGSAHVLTGRSDGLLKVVAGAPIAEGEQVCISYGDASTSNAELLDQYGFVDTSPEMLVPDQALLRHYSYTTAPYRQPPFNTHLFISLATPPFISLQELLRRHPEAVAALSASSVAEDEALLEDGGLSPHARLAVLLRLQLKRARDAASL